MENQNRSEVRTHFVMAVCGGFFGGYAIFGRMEVFGSAQTANLIQLVGDILGRNMTDAILRIGAIFIYASAMVLFTALTKKTDLNIKYLVIAVEIFTAVILGFLPDKMNPVLALYPVFFAMSLQWCVFKGAEGYGCSTIFSTNNLKQTVLSFSEYFMTDKDKIEERSAKLKKGKFFGTTILCFHSGAAYAFIGLHEMGLHAAWLGIIPILCGLCMILVEEKNRESVPQAIS